MTAILDGILNEIASVALLPRNDVENSRIPSIRDPRVKPEDDTGIGILDLFVMSSPDQAGG